MRVLVTGGAGLIGRAAVAELLEAGHEVTVLDRIGELPQLARGHARVVTGDTRDEEIVRRAVAGQERVAHLAAGASFLMYERDPIQETTGAMAGFHTVIDAAARAHVPRIVYASTSAVYEGNPVPYRETMPLSPPDLKAFAKKVNEEVADLYRKRYGIETLALRPFSVYGADEESKGPYANVASLFAWAMAAGRRPLLWGDGDQTRDFIFADDVAHALRLALDNSYAGAVNVGTGVETSFFGLISELNRLLGAELEPEHMDVPIAIYASRLLADTSVASETLGFRAQVSLTEGLTRTLERVASLESETRRRLSGMQEAFRRGVTAETLAAHKPGDRLRAA